MKAYNVFVEQCDNGWVATVYQAGEERSYGSSLIKLTHADVGVLLVMVADYIAKRTKKAE